MIDVARKILLHDKLRFAITVSGVAFAVNLVFVQVGLFLGLLDNASITIDKAGADLWVTSRNTANIDYGQAFPANYVQRVRSVPGVERADNLIVWFVRLNLPSGSTELVITYAMEDFTRWNLPWSVGEGNIQDLRRGNYVFLDESAAKHYGDFAVGDYREFLGRRMKIVGKTREVQSFTTTPVAFMDFHVAQTLDPLNLADRTIYTLVKLAPGADVAKVRAEIQRRLPYKFAMVKAIGGGNADVYRILGKQAVIAAVIGFVFGAGMALGTQPVMAQVGLKLIIPNAFFGYVFAGTVVRCLLAALISYRKVASMDAALVFRT